MCDRLRKLINYEILCLKKCDLKLNCLHILKSNLCKYLETIFNLILSNLKWTLEILMNYPLPTTFFVILAVEGTHDCTSETARKYKKLYVKENY